MPLTNLTNSVHTTKEVGLKELRSIASLAISTKRSTKLVLDSLLFNIPLKYTLRELRISSEVYCRTHFRTLC
jgi:hypothetical protein